MRCGNSEADRCGLLSIVESTGSLRQNINYLFIWKSNICFVQVLGLNSVLLVNPTIDGVHFLEFLNLDKLSSPSEI